VLEFFILYVPIIRGRCLEMKGFVGALSVTGSFLLIAHAAGQAGPRDELKGRLREAVLEAKASGRSQIQIPAPQITPPFVDNLFTVRERYTVIVGQPLQIVTSARADGNVITTWYKLKVSEVVTKQPTVHTELSLEQLGSPAHFFHSPPTRCWFQLAAEASYLTA
jgi:hypothetical protein